MSTTISSVGSDTSLDQYTEHFLPLDNDGDVAANALVSMKKRGREGIDMNQTEDYSELAIQEHSIYYFGVPQDFEGFAICNYPDGSCYTGSWKAGKRDGYGCWNIPGRGSYNGQWKLDQPHGKGKLDFDNGDRYEGVFANGEYQGEGEFVYANGTKYIGGFEQGWRHGQGRLFRVNEFFYEGNWVKDRLESEGKMVICGDYKTLQKLFPNGKV